ncbi:hypothetical protein BDN72DRAFT_824990 [Pluteus cervinus]|uniref:Uncharacterized protein n=1 Tax=Pluteus cervinus TaxID=181527 RepID=A0ACD3AI60_9AGAR|nr:hypothetical protein BDN72DRAFT_824990 [Pluteus cervinus]
MTTPKFKAKVDAINAALDKRPPFCTGVTPLGNNGALFYRKGDDGDAGYLDFASVTEDKLEALSAACAPASFGYGKETVFDESYRKAGKLDTNRFSSMLDIDSSGIAKHVSNELLEGQNSRRTLRFELYKLNVYDKDSFFKPHKDTPRAENMFGSLVITFPTPHTGGALVLRHQGEQWVVDSSSILSKQSEPSICFIAFYSDVEHEVQPLQSGHRVTLTYNLFVETNFKYSRFPPLPTVAIDRSAPDHLVLRASLSDLLQDKSVLPQGGVLAFGLRFKYPLIPDKTDLQQIIHVLKGSDATIKDVAHSLSLKVVPQILITDGTESVDVMFPVAVDWTGEQVESWATELAGDPSKEGFVVHEVGKPPLTHLAGYHIKDVIWVTPQTTFTRYKSAFICGSEDAYGNEAGFEFVYGEMCLAVMVGPPKHRETLDEIPQWNGLWDRSGFRSDSEIDDSADVDA